ncbi:DUF742 domain-containing protein [Streptosporangium sp. NPDC004631]
MDAPGWRGPGEESPLTPQVKSGRDRLIRPYAVTGGRTVPRTRLALEALVSSATFVSVDSATLSTEYQAIISLSQQVRSVAELSALLRMPLGVTRVLIADMAAEGLVQIHQPSLDAGKPDLNLLERVLSGLRRL